MAAAIRRWNRQLARELGAARRLAAQQQQQQGEQQVQQQQQAQKDEGGEEDAAAVARLAAALTSPDPTARLAAALRRRLELGVAPHIDSWPQALAALAAARGVGASGAATGGAGGGAAAAALALLAELADDALALAAGDAAVGADWYGRRAAVGAAYASTELFMLTDFSPVRRCLRCARCAVRAVVLPVVLLLFVVLRLNLAFALLSITSSRLLLFRLFPVPPPSQ